MTQIEHTHLGFTILPVHVLQAVVDAHLIGNARHHMLQKFGMPLGTSPNPLRWRPHPQGLSVALAEVEGNIIMMRSADCAADSESLRALAAQLHTLKSLPC